MLKYLAHHYDDFLKLKISNSLWFCILYGIRHTVFWGAMRLKPDDLGSLDWLNTQVNSLFILADIPASIVLLSIGHRIPEAFSSMRWIWAHGKFILICSYVLSISLFLYVNNSLIQYSDINKLALLTSVLTPDILIIGFIYKSELIKDIFSEFPIPLSKQ